MSEEKKEPVKISKKGKIKIKARSKKVKIKKNVIKDCNILEQKYNNIKSNEIDFSNKEHQNLLKCMSDKNRKLLQDNTNLNFLYPTLDNSNFNTKIANKKEFYDNRYETY